MHKTRRRQCFIRYKKMGGGGGEGGECFKSDKHNPFNIYSSCEFVYEEIFNVDVV